MYRYNFPMVSVTATVLLIREHPDFGYQMLLGKRARTASACPSMVSAPGGFLDAKTNTFKGETVRETAIREVREEVGIELHDSDLLLVNEYSDPEIDPRSHTVNIAFVAEIKFERTLNAKAGDDIESIHWYPVGEISHQLAFNHNELVSESLKVWKDRKLFNEWKLQSESPGCHQK